MIKINLASKKMAVGAASTKSSFSFGSLKGLGGAEINFDQLKKLPIRKVGVPIIIGVVLYFTTDFYKSGEMSKIEEKYEVAYSENQTLNTELNETKKFEPLKQALESDEQIIRTKIDTIEKLIAERQTPPKLLLEVSKMIPKEAWITTFKIDEGKILLNGKSTKFAYVGEFIKALNESSYFTGLEVVGTTQEKTPIGDTTNFEIKAARK